MTIKEIKNYVKELCKISILSFEKQPNKLIELGGKIGVNPPHSPGNHEQKQVIYMTQAIHSCLQTKMMLNACIYARRSCMWAAIAAIVAFLSVVLMWCIR